MDNGEITAALRVWRDGLVQLTGMSRLIKFRPTKTGAVVVQAPTADAVYSGIRGNTIWSFQGSHEEGDEAAEVPTPSSGRVLEVARAHKELGPVLRNLMRKADTEYLDRGLHVLYLAVGMLHWADLDGTQMQSPVLLLPVTLESDGPRSIPHLRSAEEDAVINPALVLRMQEFGVTIPTFDDLEDESLEGLFAAVTRAVGGRNGWEIKPTVVLSTFTFHKEAMYRDLIDNQAAIAAHPLVRALATKNPAEQTDAFMFDGIEAAEIDALAPPEDAPLVLDADSSQRAAIAAAVAGRSFVMDGPPGTGKSQTIANMIGALLEAGKTVLFVSEKAAALEVVRNRLDEAGLASFLLELHSHKARRKEVATALARALNNVALPPVGVEPLTYTEARRKRQQLNDYAEAMNVVREPLGFTLHHVLGLLSASAHLPLAPAPETPPADLTQAEYQQIREVTAQLERAWRPALQGESYLWRDVTDKASLEARLYQAGGALDELQEMTSINSEVLAAFSLHRPSQASVLIDLLDRQARRPDDVPSAWLTHDDWAALTGVRDDLRQALHTVVHAESAVEQAAAVSWRALPAPNALPPLPAPAPQVGALDPALLTADVAEECAARFEHDADLLSRCQDTVRGLAARLGISTVDTFDDITRVLDLIDLGFASERPVRAWLRPGGLEHARRAAAELHATIDTLAHAEAAASAVFTDAVLALPLTDLHTRFTTLHTGLRKLSGDYRRDRRTVAATLVSGTKAAVGIANLGLAMAWQEASERLKGAAAEHGPSLGAYWQGRQTDFARVEEAMRLTERVLHLSRGDTVDGVAAYLCDAAPPAELLPLSRQTREDLEAWKAGLAPAPALAPRPILLLQPIHVAIEWLAAQIRPLRQSAARTRAVDDATGTSHTGAQAENLLVLRTAAEDAHAALETRAPDFAAAFGMYYRGTATDLAGLDHALEWAEGTRAVAGAPLTERQYQAVGGLRPTHGLMDAWQKWTRARQRIIDAFADTRRTEISEELDGYGTARDFMALLGEDSAGQQEWFAYREARDNLARRGLDTAIDFCIDRTVPADDVPEVIHRALLRAWADNVIASDTRLQPERYEDRTALVEAYRQVDRQLVVGATHRIVRAVNARRPSATSVGEPGIIRREGQKFRKHKPVRELIAETRNTSLAIKPCFMMSPLAVSQYLPPDMRFDVVIFDEASQVTPGDAVNCIYRGRALILAGDDKQLPPTSFFDRQVDEDAEDETELNDFQSILELAKACGAFRNLGLKWHYRSRHEDLIAFSNARFYEGGLITYPSAHSEGGDVGVAFFPVDGVYRRGTTSDNPIEATKVAERVIEHFTNRPHLTLGVVAFSVAQVQAIEDALAKAREERRDLDRFFDASDRLSAFFVKSLESVQGDERDVMIMSVGYGPDEAGKISTNFGPLNKAKGWRRLNVAITRARYRIEIVSSLRAGSIPDSLNENVRHIQSYLDYAERGRTSLALDPYPSGKGPESPFEEAVIRTIRSWGYTVEPQVGAAGFRIDMAVRHPAHPGVFALGIECDGYQYHSAPSARDRDRLREQVLVGLGWRLHRIWGTSWYRNRPTEETRLRAAIEQAIAAPVEGRLSTVPTDRPQRPTVAVEAVDHEAPPSWTSEYVTATIGPLPRSISPSSPDSRYKMVPAIERLAEVEGPVHISVVHARLRTAWYIGQVGSKIRANIDAAIRLADVTREGDFIDLPDRPLAAVRRPGDGVVRTVDQIHPDELGIAMVHLISDAGPLPRTDLIIATARVFGWHRTGRDISTALDVVIDLLVEDGVLEHSDGLVATSASTPDQTRGSADVIDAQVTWGSL